MMKMMNNDYCDDENFGANIDVLKNFYLDDILLDYRGQTVTVADLITDVQTEHKQLYDLIFKPTLDLVNVLPKT